MGTGRIRSAFRRPATLLSVIGLMLAIGAATAFAATITVDSPGDGGWNPRVTSADGRVEFVTGPGTPPMGSGSARLFTGTDGSEAAELRHTGYDGVELADIDELSYSTYVTSWNVPGPSGGQTPYLILEVDHNGDQALEDLLFFEPEYTQSGYTSAVPDQGGPDLNTWQDWDARRGAWYSVFGSAGSGPGTGVISFDAYVAAFPSARIVNRPDGRGGLRVVSGFAGVADDFDANVDGVRVAIDGGSDDTYDFERAPGSTVVELGAGGGDVSSDADNDGATAGDGEVEIESPSGGPVSIQKSASLGSDPTGWELFGTRFTIETPAAPSAADPISMSFYVDDGDVPAGVTASELQVFKDGASTPVPDCAGAPGEASPDPCVDDRGTDGDDLFLTVLTSDASAWVLGADTVGPTITLDQPYEGARYSIYANDPKDGLLADYSCSDPGSGVATCAGNVPDGATFDHTTLGPRTFTVNATDGAGNPSTLTHNYENFTFAGLIHDDNPLAYYRLGDPDASSTMAASAGPDGEYKNEQESEPFGIAGDGDAARYFFDSDSNGVGDGYGYANGIQAPQDYTMSAFFRIDDDTRTQMVAEQGGAGSVWYHAELPGHNHLHFRPVVWDSLRLTTPSGSVEDDGWYHVAAVYDYTPNPLNDQLGSGTARLYLNGDLVDTDTSPQKTSGAATFYAGYGQMAPWLHGYLDEVAYFPTALSATHIYEIWLADPPPDDGAGAGSGSGGGTSSGGGSGSQNGGGTGGTGDGSGAGSNGGGGSGGSGGGGGGGTADAGRNVLRLGNSVTQAGKTAMVPLFGGDDPSSGNVAVDAGNRRLGASKFSLDAGEDTYVEINLSKKERKILRKRTKVDVTVYSGGGSDTKTLRVSK